MPSSSGDDRESVSSALEMLSRLAGDDGGGGKAKGDGGGGANNPPVG